MCVGELASSQPQQTPEPACSRHAPLPPAREQPHSTADTHATASACLCSARLQVTVDDFELLSDCKATATLQLRPGARVASWDALVLSFVGSL